MFLSHFLTLLQEIDSSDNFIIIFDWQLIMNQSEERTQSDIPTPAGLSLNTSIRNSRSLKTLPHLFLGQSGTFGSSSRGNLFVSSVCSPSAKYNIKSGFQISLMHKKGTSMSSSRSSLGKSNFSYIQKTSNPGPGAYNPQKPKSKKKVVIGLKNKNELKEGFLNEKAIPNNPGPSKYSVKDKPVAGGKIVCLSLRFDANRQNKPGPSTYFKGGQQKTLNSNQNTVFGKNQRKTYFEEGPTRSVSPGPGQYRLHSQFR